MRGLFQFSRHVAGSRHAFAEQIASPSAGPPAVGSMGDTGEVWQTDRGRLNLSCVAARLILGDGRTAGLRDVGQGGRMRAAEEREVREFVSVRLLAMRRFAYLLCGDPHDADDVVSATLAKLVRRWPKVRRLEHPDSYLRRMLVRTYLDERRRPWRRERPTDPVPEPEPGPSPLADVVDRATLLALLATLPPRRRAVLVLRFFEDLSVEQTAEALGCAVGTVKAHTHQGLADLKARLGGQPQLIAQLKEDL